MNRSLALRTAAIVGSAILMMGCAADNTYRPNVDPTQLAATAAKEAYPTAMSPETAPDMIYEVQPNGVITIYNAGDTAPVGFTLWVAKSFSVFVDRLPAHTYRSFAPETVFNNSGKNLTVVPVGNFSPIQIMSNGHLYTLAGPVHPMEQ